METTSMKTDVLNLKGEKVGDVELNEAIFGRAWNGDLVHQAVVTAAANRRKPWAHAKTRDEVSGGGKKPWKQKGTGRARHGSTRSPIWVGGGAAHGPRNDRDYSKKLNKKMARAALYCALSKKLADGEMRFVDSLTIESTKTKDLVGALKNFFKANQPPSTLLVSADGNNSLVRISNNVPKVDTIHGSSIGISDLLSHQNVLIEKEAIEQIR
ncbi:MAG: 50S ribosomal protein L4 [Candidatus Harrisonbacteria bacterium CG10_big_fil_rev_8_21_14_0_10_49_15]|uniref:Large ribosomal subunit protein uL4 n=1 Tax=Candidatus Harrisonbacteria bacterium CG10_big_fil_rev_8_21_14_0_10_49_15 TaxID=1974587 RepID=A0A2H0UKX7_9BACT|nr:MAG: 50S ribosomal protein L4 [Candidatus Harrisonbacteria bacterium CG10_big_fil_rev_8_21_14_0_10_49_15]